MGFEKDSKSVKYGLILCALFLQVIIAASLKTVYNNYELYNWYSENGNLTIPVTNNGILVYTFLIMATIAFLSVIRKSNLKILSISFFVILAIAFILIPKIDHDEFLINRYKMVINMVDENPEFRPKAQQDRFSFFYPSSIDSKVYSKNEAYKELMNGYMKRDPKILYKYSETDNKYDLFIARTNQQRHIITLLSLNNEKINEVLKGYNADHFISIGEYNKFIEKLRSENIITKEQADIYF